MSVAAWEMSLPEEWGIVGTDIVEREVIAEHEKGGAIVVTFRGALMPVHVHLPMTGAVGALMPIKRNPAADAPASTDRPGDAS